MRSVRSRLFGDISLSTAITAALGFAATAAGATTSTSGVFDAHPAPAATTAAPDGNGNGGTGFSGGNGGSGSGGSGSGGTPANSVIVFTPGDFYDYDPSQPNDAVFIANSAQPSKTFTFTVASTAYNVTGAKLRDTVKGTVATASPNGAEGQGIGGETVVITLSVQPTGTGTQTGTVTLVDSGTLFDNHLDGSPLFFEITWTQEGGVEGSSFSRTFTYVSSTAIISTVLPYYTNTNPIFVESRIGGSQTAAVAKTVTSTTSQPTATNGNGSMSGPTLGGGSTSTGSGISKGAIAGIVVGAVAAIAIIAALVFFFLRRHSRNRNRAANQAYNSALLSGSVEPYRGAGPGPDLGGPGPNMHPTTMHDGMGSGTAINLMEKDAVVAGAAGVGAAGVAGRFAGPDTPNSPHSPYTDDDNSTPQIIPTRPVPTSSSAGASAAASPTVRAAQNATPAVSPVAASAQPVTPVAPVGAGAGAGADAGTSSATAAQPALRGQVAALIEDHMTPEDVARLEAEERELDADIENAIRNRAAASSR
ncbi:hypothetical protein SPBR_07040 [Sporothrix brasiliensis 5110]|uniref:Uncharacterized protein n=1 Tax=Sporothrix brasiliensis 5110 TaxID=1398154 RepID=A0A0C2IXC2_9PEZI|nr:uncharacterized protein SPBR_07040 [Sporothrix brasiliensis 5110]KIH89652.1 hypothetical protein SPBR_07040 [Sporothrix brasiliensis 5110]